uniref:Uncharacterized protein n=1 Tax=Acrobeloides nanus TaxID=290746 RepID=A0A914EQK8_9BILA
MNEKEYVDVAGIYEEISTSLGKKNLFLKALEVSTKNRAAFISSSGNSCAESSEDKAKGKAALVAITVEKESSEDFEDEFSDSFSDSISDEFMNKARLLFEELIRLRIVSIICYEVSIKNRATLISPNGNRCAESTEEKAMKEKSVEKE